MRFEFVEEPKGVPRRYETKIRVIGIGGAGGNAINNMISAGLRGVDFAAANTDCQDLERSLCSQRIQLGPNTTLGMGTGADQGKGKLSAEESIDEIRAYVEGADMVFLTAGMGGGTGTGAAPVIAKVCREAKALTVAVVTKPFLFEGDTRMRRALEGIGNLKDQVDSLIIIPNERLKSLGIKGVKDIFIKADEVLLNAVRGISDLIQSKGFINLDFADVRRVMSMNGTAIMGMGVAKGQNKASEAAQAAVNSPLLEDVSISGAKGLLMNFTGHSEMDMEEIDEASNYIRNEVSKNAEIFFGVVFNDDMQEEVRVTVIATGINGDAQEGLGYDGEVSGKVIRLRGPLGEESHLTEEPAMDALERPAYLRKGVSLNESPRTKDAPAKEGGWKGLKKFITKNPLEAPTFMRVKAD